jgi:hypothetical protein
LWSLSSWMTPRRPARNCTANASGAARSQVGTGLFRWVGGG